MMWGRRTSPTSQDKTRGVIQFSFDLDLNPKRPGADRHPNTSFLRPLSAKPLSLFILTTLHTFNVTHKEIITTLKLVGGRIQGVWNSGQQ